MMAHSYVWLTVDGDCSLGAELGLSINYILCYDLKSFCSKYFPKIPSSMDHVPQYSQYCVFPYLESTFTLWLGFYQWNMATIMPLTTEAMSQEAVQLSSGCLGMFFHEMVPLGIQLTWCSGSHQVEKHSDWQSLLSWSWTPIQDLASWIFIKLYAAILPLIWLFWKLKRFLGGKSPEMWGASLRISLFIQVFSNSHLLPIMDLSKTLCSLLVYLCREDWIATIGGEISIYHLKNF